MTAVAPNIIFDFYSRDVDDADVHSITLTSTLKDYLPYAGATALTATKAFILTNVNPCLSTAITADPIQIENLVSFAGFNSTSLLKYTFNDTLSITKTLTTDSADFCGDKKISVYLNSTLTDWLGVKNQDVITFSPP